MALTPRPCPLFRGVSVAERASGVRRWHPAVAVGQADKWAIYSSYSAAIVLSCYLWQTRGVAKPTARGRRAPARNKACMYERCLRDGPGLPRKW